HSHGKRHLTVPGSNPGGPTKFSKGGDYLARARASVSWKKAFSMLYGDQCLCIGADGPSYEWVLLTFLDDDYSILFDRSIELGLDTMLGCSMVVYKPAPCSLLRCYCRFR